MVLPLAAVNWPSEPRWYFTSPEPWVSRGIEVALELAEDLAVGLADDVGQHVQASAVRHADDRLVDAALGRLLAQLVEEHDRRLAALEGEPLLADELRLQEGLEDLRLVELVEDPQVLLAWPGLERTLEALLDPGALLVVGDVHVLHADAAAVGAAQHGEDVAHRRDLAGVAAEAADRELAVEVPQRQAVVLDRQFRVAALPELQRVDVGHEVAEVAVGVDQAEDPGAARDRAGPVVADVAGPADRGVRHPQGVEDLVVEVVLADQQLVHPTEELPGLRALDDPVVVGGGERGHLRDAQLVDPSPCSRPGTPAGSRSSRRRGSCPGRPSAGARSGWCRARPGWSATRWCRRSRRR